MTKQEIFDTVLFNLRAQGRASMNATDCMYRGENGAKCAVGWLIPDELYSDEIEDLNVWDAWVLQTLQQAGIEVVRPDTLDLLKHLQIAHDKQLAEEGVQEWEDQMQCIAGTFELHYTPREVQA